MPRLFAFSFAAAASLAAFAQPAEAGGKPIKSAGDFVEAVNAAAPTKVLHLTVQRAGKDYTPSVLLDQAAPAANP